MSIPDKIRSTFFDGDTLLRPGPPVSDLSARQREAQAPWAILAKHQRNFSFSASPLYEELAILAKHTCSDIVESSVKVADGMVHPRRCNLYYEHRESVPQAAGHMFDFLDRALTRCGEQTDYSVLDALVARGFRIGHCRKAVLGLDERETRGHTRIKFYFLLDEGNEDLVRTLYELAGMTDPPPMFLKWTTLFGIDFGFDGSSRLKIYPGFPHFCYEEVARRLELGRRAMAIMKQAPFCMVSLSGRIFLQLLLPGTVVRQTLNHPVARSLNPETQYILGLLPGEIENDRITHFNIYYNDEFNKGAPHV